MKAQAAVEFVLIFAIILAFVVAILLTGFKQAEVVMATSAARSAASQCASDNGFILGQMDAKEDAVIPNFDLTPMFYDAAGTPIVPLPAYCKTQITNAIKKTLGEHLTPEGETCAWGGQYHYCVV